MGYSIETGEIKMAWFSRKPQLADTYINSLIVKEAKDRGKPIPTTDDELDIEEETSYAAAAIKVLVGNPSLPITTLTSLYPNRREWLVKERIEHILLKAAKEIVRLRGDLNIVQRLDHGAYTVRVLTGPNPVKEDLMVGLLVQAGVENTLRDASNQIYWLRQGKTPPEIEKIISDAKFTSEPDREGAGAVSWGSSWSDLGKPKRPTEPEMLTFAEQIAAPLNVQLDFASNMSGRGERLDPKPRALGYVYGWTDAFLRVRGWDMADKAIGVPVLFHSFRRLWPGQEGKLLAYIGDHLSDNAVMAGMMHGGQQYLDWQNKKVSAPMGLVRFLSEDLS
jgi:hypothetical protein